MSLIRPIVDHGVHVPTDDQELETAVERLLSGCTSWCTGINSLFFL